MRLRRKKFAATVAAILLIGGAGGVWLSRPAEVIRRPRAGRSGVAPPDRGQVDADDPIGRGKEHQLTLMNRSLGLKVRELPREEWLAFMAARLLDGVSGIVYHGDADQIPYLVRWLDQDVATTTARRYARALAEIEPYLAKDLPDPVPLDGWFVPGKAGEATAAIDRLDAQLEPSAKQLEKDVSLYFDRTRPR